MNRDSRYFKYVNVLDLVPGGKVKHFLNESGKVDLLVPKFRNEKFARWFIPSWRSPYITLHLDVHGSKVWLGINGEKNVRQICDALEGESGENTPERVGKFMTELYSNGCVSFRQFEER